MCGRRCLEGVGRRKEVGGGGKGTDEFVLEGSRRRFEEVGGCWRTKDREEV